MGQITRGIALTKKSWLILTDHRHLMLFTIYGGIASIFAALLYFYPAGMLLESGNKPGAIFIGLVGAYCVTFIGIYFNVALAATADKVMRGEKADFSYGIQIANKRTGAIAGWAFVALAVSQLIRQLRNLPYVGKLLATGLSLLWSLITFLVIPIIALENVGPIEAVKRSGALLKQQWGSRIAGNVIIGFVALVAMVLFVLVGMLGLMMISGGGAALGVPLIAVAIVGFIAAMIAQAAMRQIFGVALYRFAADGTPVGGFTTAEMQSAVKQRKFNN